MSGLRKVGKISKDTLDYLKGIKKPPEAMKILKGLINYRKKDKGWALFRIKVHRVAMWLNDRLAYEFDKKGVVTPDALKNILDSKSFQSEIDAGSYAREQLEKAFLIMIKSWGKKPSSESVLSGGNYLTEQLDSILEAKSSLYSDAMMAFVKAYDVLETFFESKEFKSYKDRNAKVYAKKAEDLFDRKSSVIFNNLDKIGANIGERRGNIKISTKKVPLDKIAPYLMKMNKAFGAFEKSESGKMAFKKVARANLYGPRDALWEVFNLILEANDWENNK